MDPVSELSKLTVMTDFRALLSIIEELKERISSDGGVVKKVQITHETLCASIFSDVDDMVQVDHLSPQGYASYKVRKDAWLENTGLLEIS
jgi:hypothetical protein